MGQEGALKMGVIGPIKDKQVMERMKEYLREQSTRNYLLFRLGINLGIPMTDLLHLRVEDVAEKKEFTFGDYRIRISDTLQKEIDFYIGGRKEGYLFRMASNRPLSRFQLYNILRDAAEVAGFTEPVGAMTLRKTFAYWAHKEQKVYLPLLSKYLNHHTISYTLKYIDAESDKEINVCLTEMDL